MAQWIGQFTSNTHETKVKDIEESLCIAIESFKASPPDQAQKKLKAVRHLSERLMAARLKMVRARLKALREIQDIDDEKLSRLKLQEQEIQEKGVNSIFEKFGVASHFKKE